MISVDAGLKEPLIAGSVGPYGAYLHDGSEYTGNYTGFVTDSELIDYHEPRIKALVEEGVDLLAIETIPSKREALIILNIVRKFPNIKVWVSFSCKVIFSFYYFLTFNEIILARWHFNCSQ